MTTQTALNIQRANAYVYYPDINLELVVRARISSLHVTPELEYATLKDMYVKGLGDSYVFSNTEQRELRHLFETYEQAKESLEKY